MTFKLISILMFNFKYTVFLSNEMEKIMNFLFIFFFLLVFIIFFGGGVESGGVAQINNLYSIV